MIEPVLGAKFVFLASWPHHHHEGLWQVVWRLWNGSLSFDALSPHQVVGELVPVEPHERAAAFGEAVGVKIGDRNQ